MHLDDLTGALRRLVGDVRGRDQEVEVELALETLADDLHVEQTEEAAAETETQRLRRLGLVREGRIVQLEPFERIPELRVRVGIGREDPGEHHRLDVLVPGQGLRGRAPARSERVTDSEPGDVLQPGHDVPDLASAERVDGLPYRRHDAELLGLERGSLNHRAERLARLEAPVDDAHERDHSAVLVVGRVEHERTGRRVGITRGRWNPLDESIEDLPDSRPRLRRDAKHLVRRLADELPELGRGRICVGLRQVDLVGDRDDLQVVVEREVRVCERLRLDALRGVDEEERPLAGLQGARDLVAEVDVPRGVDQVQIVIAPADSHRLGLDRDPALAFELHRIEHLLAHVALGDRARQLEDAIRERRLPVVDVRDDREVAKAVLLHRKRRF